MGEGRKKFKDWLKTNKISLRKLSEKDIYEIIDKTVSRRWY